MSLQMLPAQNKALTMKPLTMALLNMSGQSAASAETIDMSTAAPSGATFSRTGTATIQALPDSQIVTALTGEARFAARRVENLVSDARDVTDVTSPTKIGCTSTAQQIVFSGNGYHLGYHYNTANKVPDWENQVLRFTARIKASSATTLVLWILNQSGAAYDDFESISVTTDYQIFSISATGAGALAGSTLIATVFSNLTSQGAGGAAVTVDVDWYQLELVTGQANTNPSSVAEQVAYRDYANGNTVASNIVTEAQGAAFSDADLKGVLIEKERTNYISLSNSLLSWSKINTPTLTLQTSADGIGPGIEYTNVVLQWADGDSVYRTALSSLADGTPTFPSFWIRKKSGAENLRVFHYSGGAKGHWDLDFSALSSDWERITRDSPAVTVIDEMEAGTSGEAGLWLVYALTTDSVLDFDICGVMQPGQAPSNTSIISTDGSTVTRDGDLLRIPASDTKFDNWSASSGSLVAKVEMLSVTATSGDERVIFDFGGNVRLYVDDAGVVKLTDGTNTVTGGSVTGNSDKVAFSWLGGVAQIAVNGTAGTAGTFSMTLGATFGIGCDADADADQLDGYMKSFDVDLSLSESQLESRTS